MKVSVIGTGKTGSAVVNLLGDKAIPFDAENPPTPEALRKTDIAIIFVPGSAAAETVECVLEAGIPAVWGTTGYEWPQNLHDRVVKVDTKWVIGSNFSLGMNLVRNCLNFLGSGSSLLSDPEFHIHEIHHVHKKDAPSGTALSWKEWINRDATISSSREGDVKGIHELRLKTDFETITLKHEAHKRELFAEGAIWTANHILNSDELSSGLHKFSSIFDNAFKEQL